MWQIYQGPRAYKQGEAHQWVGEVQETFPSGTAGKEYGNSVCHLKNFEKSPMVISCSCKRTEVSCCPLGREWDLTRGRLWETVLWFITWKSSYRALLPLESRVTQEINKINGLLLNRRNSQWCIFGNLNKEQYFLQVLHLSLMEIMNSSEKVIANLVIINF